MMTLSAFADEISPDLTDQLQVLSQADIHHLELRGIWDKNVLRLTSAELQTAYEQITQAGVRVSAIGSPIGKILITDDFAPHLRDFDQALEVAHAFGTPYIRIFSFFIPEGAQATDYRDEVLRRLSEFVHRAERKNIILLHENEKHIYGDTPERCRDLLQTIHSPHLRLAFDPANFVQCGVRPMIDAYPQLAEFIAYVHIKDAYLADGRVVPAGLGDGDVPALLRALQEQNYDGFLSLEPHLASAHAYAGFSGPELFLVATKALKSLLQDQRLPWQ